MNAILYVIGLVSLVLLLALLAYLFSVLRSVKGTLTEVQSLVKNLEANADIILKESTQLVISTNTLVNDIQVKSEKINSVVEVAGTLGDACLGLRDKITNYGTYMTASDTDSPDLPKGKVIISSLSAITNSVKTLLEMWKNRE